MVILAGTSKGVFTIDAGDTAEVLQSRGVRDLYRWDRRCFAGTGAGLFASDDDGATWTSLGMTDREVWQVRGAAGVLYAGTAPHGLFRSDDDGDTWREIEAFAAIPESDRWCVPVQPPAPARARAIVVDDDDPERVWVGVEVGGVARTADGGRTWTVDLPGDNPDLHMMSAHPDLDGVLFASTGYGRPDGVADMVEGNAGVFRSDDGGASWEYAWQGITPRYSRPMCIDRRAPYALTVASAPNAFSNHAEDGGAGAMLFRSVDGGRSWRSLCDDAHSPSAANFHGLMPDPDSVGGVVVGTDTGEVWRVDDDGTWNVVAVGLPAVLALA